MGNPSLPTGIVTFLFTDIQGSTLLWENSPELMAVALQVHNSVLRQAIHANGGVVFKVVGDSFQAAFPVASQAVKAAIEAQRGLKSTPWNELGPLEVRMGLHVGEAELDPEGDEYAVSHTKNRVARIVSVGYGGQILITSAVVELLGGQLPKDVVLKDMGNHHLRGLLHPEHLFQVVVPDLPAEFPPLKTEEPLASLPLQATPFFDREAELEKIERLLGDPGCRLITLAGMGGSGKTRLAIEAARNSKVFPRNVYFVGLASITSLDDLILNIAEVVRYSFHAPPGVNLPMEEAKSQLLRYLTDKNALLVLDNFEQLASCSSLLSDLLAATAEIKLIVTSRVRLNLPGEWVLEIDGLSFPLQGTDKAIPDLAAVQLFIESAERTGQFDKTECDWPAIARICRLLEGMPLGIEMAAAWVKMLSCQEIAAEIERDLDFLTATWLDVPERHHTLRAVFETSWRMLPEEERKAFYYLSVFRDGFRREAALQVASAPLPMLAALVDKSFIRRVASGRFEIHPVLQQYAVEKLSHNPTAQAEARIRHTHYFSELMSQMFAKLKGEEQLDALSAMRAETQNLRLAFRGLVEQREFKHLEGALPALILFYEMNNQRVETQEVIKQLADLEQSLRQALATVPDVETDRRLSTSHQILLALTLAALRHFSMDFQHPGLTAPNLDESLWLAQGLPDSEVKAYAILLNCRGPSHLTPDQKLDLCQQSFAIFKRLDDSWGAALAQLIWADELNFNDLDFDMSRAAYQASLGTFRKAKDLWGQALCLNGITVIEQKTGHFEEAYRLGRQSVELFRELGNFERIAQIHHWLAEIAINLGSMDDARRHFEANRDYFTQLGDMERREYFQERLARLDLS